jgi:ABC-type oligopeptide transport system substrate-binding subunit
VRQALSMSINRQGIADRLLAGQRAKVRYDASPS